MQLEPHWARWLLPKRLRTIMFINLAVAILMGALLPMRRFITWNSTLFADTILFLLTVSVIGALISVPPVLVQMYLYPRKRGLWYSWHNPSPRRARDGAGVPVQSRYPRSPEATSLRSHWIQVLSTKTPRTRLFEGAPPADSPSRAALLLTVATRLEQSGKKEAARKCYRQIVDRFAATPEAQEAARRIEGIAGNEHIDRQGVGCPG